MKTAAARMCCYPTWLSAATCPTSVLDGTRGLSHPIYSGENAKGDPKKRLELVGQRKNAQRVIAELGMSERLACELLDLDRSGYCHQPKPERNAELRVELIALNPPMARDKTAFWCDDNRVQKANLADAVGKRV